MRRDIQSTYTCKKNTVLTKIMYSFMRYLSRLEAHSQSQSKDQRTKVQYKYNVALRPETTRTIKQVNMVLYVRRDHRLIRDGDKDC